MEEPKEFLQQMTEKRLIKNDTKIPQVYETVRGTVMLRPGEQQEIDIVVEKRVDMSKIPMPESVQKDNTALKDQLKAAEEQISNLMAENNKLVEAVSKARAEIRQLKTQIKKQG